jgi:hypothetical protein
MVATTDNIQYRQNWIRFLMNLLVVCRGLGVHLASVSFAQLHVLVNVWMSSTPLSVQCFDMSSTS